MLPFDLVKRLDHKYSTPKDDYIPVSWQIPYFQREIHIQDEPVQI